MGDGAVFKLNEIAGQWSLLAPELANQSQWRGCSTLKSCLLKADKKPGRVSKHWNGKVNLIPKISDAEEGRVGQNLQITQFSSRSSHCPTNAIFRANAGVVYYNFVLKATAIRSVSCFNVAPTTLVSSPTPWCCPTICSQSSSYSLPL